jgi:hypothetical protein
MARKSRTVSSTKSTKQAPKRRPLIPEPFQTITSATAKAAGVKIEVPMLVLYGEWLKAVGFPIGSAAVLTTDRHGELALHGVGLRLPRRLYVRAVPR